ncbi:hypothetical protein BH10PSE15_BH10PSE15_13940 [soil metagenome]
MPIDAWFLVAMLCSLGGYGVYLAGLRRHLVQPNRASWLIWSAGTAVEAATYTALNPGAIQAWVFILAAASCIVVTLAIWREGDWAAPSRSEAACMAANLAALAIWLAFRQTFWAHMLIVAVVPLGFWPTWQSVWQDRTRERSPAWGLWTIADLATLLVATHTDTIGGQARIGEYAYILAELLCHASVWFMVGLASINPLRSFGYHGGRLYVLDAYAPATHLFSVGETPLGKAIYAVDGFAEGPEIVRFTGRRFRADKVPSLLHGASDRFVQVTPDSYMGPSGRIDDLINHSCTPNAGLRFTGNGVMLVAIRPIAPGEEINWDYSTTLSASDWHMICQCRSPECRRVIGNFETLPADRQAWFRARDLVAPYLRATQPIAANERAA